MISTACSPSATAIAVLGGKKVLVEGTVAEMMQVEKSPGVKSYFRGKRARQLDLTARQQV